MPKTWRLLVEPDGLESEPMTARAIADLLWNGPTGAAWGWATPSDGGEGSFPTDVPEVHAVLLEDRVRLARAWLDRERERAWVFEFVMNLSQYHPSAAWDVLLTLIAEARSDEHLALVAAGPMEELLKYHGPEVIGTVEAEATTNSPFRSALSGVWRSSIADDVWARVCRLTRT